MKFILSDTQVTDLNQVIKLVDLTTYVKQQNYFLIAIFIFLSFSFGSGCTAIPELPTENAKFNVRKIAIIPAKTLPKANFNTYAKSRLSGAGKGLLTGFGLLVISPIAGAAYGSIIPGGGTVVGAFLGAAAGALYFPISPIVGAIKAVPAEESERTQRIIQNILINLKVQDSFANHIYVASLDNVSNYTFKIINNYDTGQQSKDLNESLKSQGFDTLLEVTIDEIGFDGGEGSNPSFAFFIKGNYRLIKIETNIEFYTGQLSYKSIDHTMEEWAADDSKLLQNEFDHGYHKLATEIMEDYFL